jgi:anti-sigma factor RsiW
MSKCPDIGLLKMYSDGECAASLAEIVSLHLEDCSDCRRELAALNEATSFAGDRLAVLVPSPVEEPSVSAFRVMNAARAGKVQKRSVMENFRERMLGMVMSGRKKAVLAGLAAVLVLAVAFALPPVRTAADDLLSIFRVERFQPVSVNPSERINNLMDLSQLGNVEMQNVNTQTTKLGSVAEAKALNSLPVLAPSYLPQGVTGDPTVQMMNGGSMKFTFDTAKAKAYLDKIGEKNFTVPDRFNGAGFTVKVNPVLSIAYGMPQAAPNATEPKSIEAANALMIVESNSPTVETFGNVSIGDLRDFLLSVPGLPPSLVSQLKAIEDWSTTMPVPIPVGKDMADQVTVNGHSGLLVADDTVKMAGVIWSDNGTLYFVGGSYPKDEVMKVAASMK